MAVLTQRNQIRYRSVSAVSINVMDHQYFGMLGISAVIAAALIYFPCVISVASRPFRQKRFLIPVRDSASMRAIFSVIFGSLNSVLCYVELAFAPDTRSCFSAHTGPRATQLSAKSGSLIVLSRWLKFFSAPFANLVSERNSSSLELNETKMMSVFEFCSRVYRSLAAPARADRTLFGSVVGLRMLLSKFQRAASITEDKIAANMAVKLDSLLSAMSAGKLGFTALKDMTFGHFKWIHEVVVSCNTGVA